MQSRSISTLATNLITSMGRATGTTGLTGFGSQGIGGPHHRVWYHGHYWATLIERGEARAYRATPLVRDSLGQVFGKTGDSASG
jgi:hypothetical protein